MLVCLKNVFWKHFLRLKIRSVIWVYTAFQDGLEVGGSSVKSCQNVAHPVNVAKTFASVIVHKFAMQRVLITVWDVLFFTAIPHAVGRSDKLSVRLILAHRIKLSWSPCNLAVSVISLCNVFVKRNDFKRDLIGSLKSACGLLTSLSFWRVWSYIGL